MTEYNEDESVDGVLAADPFGDDRTGEELCDTCECKIQCGEREERDMSLLIMQFEHCHEIGKQDFLSDETLTELLLAD